MKKFPMPLAFALLSLMLSSVIASAADKKAADKITLNPSMSHEQLLKQLHSQGANATVLLSNGKSYSGRVGAVGSRSVVIEALDNKDYYDALVKTQEIVAIEVRVRGD